MIHDGILRALASPGELKHSLQGQLFKVVCAKPFDAVAFLDGTPGIYYVALQGNDVHTLVDMDTLPAEEIARRLVARGISVSEVRQVEPTLEDVFINLIGRPGNGGIKVA